MGKKVNWKDVLWQAIVAAITAAFTALTATFTALTATSCMGYGPLC